MENAYRVLCLFILTSGLFRLNAASSLPHSHRNFTQTPQHNRISYSPTTRNNSTEISVELRRHSLLPSLQRQPHHTRHDHHHHQHPSKHNKSPHTNAYHQSDDTAFYNNNRLPVNQRPSHPSTEHNFFGDGGGGTENTMQAANVPLQKNMPQPSTHGPNAHHQRQHQMHHQQQHGWTRLRQNSIDTRNSGSSSLTKKHSTNKGDAIDSNNNGMLVPLRINNNSNNNNNSNRIRNNSHYKMSAPAATPPPPSSPSHESAGLRGASQTAVRDICSIFNLPKNCGMRSASNNKAFSIQSDSGNVFVSDSAAFDALASRNDDEMDLTLPTTDKNASNERHLRSNKRSQRDGHSSRSTSNHLNYDEKNDNANDGRMINRRRTTFSSTASRVLNGVRILNSIYI